jgi:hypothetical protein
VLVFALAGCGDDGNEPAPGTASSETRPTASACPEIGSFGVGSWPPACWRPYADSGPQASPFNRPVQGDPPLLPNSAAIVEQLVFTGGPIPAPIVVGSGEVAEGGVAVYWSRPSDPLLTLDCSVSSCPLDGLEVRLPVGAEPDGGFDPPPWDHDAHMAIVDQASGWEYDLYNVQSRTASTLRFGTSKHVGGRTRIDGDGLGTSANAASYALLGGLIRIQELQAGSINHALAIVVPCTDDQPVYPAGDDDLVCADPTNAPAMGAHFQLDMSQDEIDALDAPSWQKTIYTALRRYGAYVSDTASSEFPEWGIEVESPNSYESFPGYRGDADPWARFASRAGIAQEDGEYRFRFTRDGALDGPPSLDWGRRLRVLDPCTARGAC